MAKIRIYQQPTGAITDGSYFVVNIQQNNVWYDRKISWGSLKTLLGSAESLVYSGNTLTFTTPDGTVTDVLHVDNIPTENSINPVSSGGMFTALAGKVDKEGSVTGVKGNSESTYRTGNVNITKANVGLGNVDNTSDANKPISNATQTALNAKLNTSAFEALGLSVVDGAINVTYSES